jgi:hypothetical protein
MNNLPNNVAVIILKNMSGTELAQLAVLSRRFRAMINKNETLRNRIRTNRNWAFMNERELRTIAAELREFPNRGYHLNHLLARYNQEIARRNRIAAKAEITRRAAEASRVKKRSVKRR